MKSRIAVLFAVFLPFLVSGCGTKEEMESNLEPGIYLTATVPGADVHALTKAGEGVVALNENVIKSVYYLIYKTTEVDDDPSTALPKLSGHFSGLESETATTGAMTTRHIPISAGIIADLFPSGTKDCRIIVVANPTASLTTVLESNPSIDVLRSSVVTANFTTTKAQDSFVMVYDDLATVEERTGSVIAQVDAELTRLAGKITVTAKVLDGFYDSVAGWYVPECGGLKVTFVNGFSKTNLMGDFDSIVTDDDDWFDSAEISFGAANKQTISDVDYYFASASSPIYSYPMKWDFSEHNEPYLLVELPWRCAGENKDSGTGTITSYYYKFMLSTKSLAANSWYNLELSLKILGSPNKVEPTQQYLYENYQVYDWNKAFVDGEYNNVDADIREARYLVVPETDFVLNNQPSWNIPFTSSHECEIVNATYTVTNFSVNPAQQTTPAYINTLTPACTISLNGSVITFNHSLRNDISGGAGTYDVSPYDFTFTIRHKDDYSFTQEIHIRQYPAIYIDAQLNSYSNSSGESFEQSGTTVSGWTGTAMFGTVLENNSSAPSPYDNSQGATTSTYGYTFHNQGWIFLIGGNPRGGGLGSNKNGNMYVITTSTAPSLRLKMEGDAISAFSGEPVIIGDPREHTVNNLLYNSQNWSASSPALYDGSSSRKMTYYFPTGTSATASKTIAPKFRIASSWGTANEMTYVNAQRKCSAYQEDGYPAGRWRIPTEAEMQYIMKLSGDGVIPPLFGSLSSTSYDIAYWCNNGYITTNVAGTTYKFNNNPNNSSTLLSTRCVYDEWYWENSDSYVTNTTYQTTKGRLPSQGTTPDYQTFVWGDMPR